MQGFLEAVRAACPGTVWSRGVELARAGAVFAEEDEGERVVLRVRTKGGLVCPLVTLFPEDGEWDCDCGSRADCCEHVAAAAIALAQARREGHSLVAPRQSPRCGRIGYRLKRWRGGLFFDRVVVFADHEEPLTTSLIAVAYRRVEGPAFLADQRDLEIERALGAFREGPLDRGLALHLVPLLEGCPDLLLDGQPIEASGRPQCPSVRLEDFGGGFRLSMALPEEPPETFSCGLARHGKILRPIGDDPLTAREREWIGRGWMFGTHQLGELVTEVLPSLQRRLAVEILTSRLPGTSIQRPRVLVDTSEQEGVLTALAWIVYGNPPTARLDGDRLVPLQGPLPLRDPRNEQALARRLLNDLGLVPGRAERFCGPSAVTFAAKLKGWEAEVRGDGCAPFALVPPLIPHLQLRGDDFDLHFFSEGAGAEGSRRFGHASPGEVLSAWRRGETIVPLLPGGWAPLPGPWLEKFGPLLEGLVAAKEEGGALPRASVFDLARLAEELGEPPPPSFQALRALVGDFTGIPSSAPPSDLRAELRGYQHHGVDWLIFLRSAALGGLLADDMGLGKTLQALCTFEGRCLVVAPTSVLFNWAEEIRRFRPALSVDLYHGPRRELDPSADVTLTSYALLRLDMEKLEEVIWNTVVLDEAQAIKNADSQVARAAFRLKGRFRVALTGTPVENRLDELWSQFHFLNPGLLGSRRSFDELFARPIAAGEPGVAEALRRKIRPFLLRRLKRDVAPELPPRTDVVLRCELAPEERAVYDSLVAATREEVLARLKAGGSVLAALEALLRLRQAACHPALLPGQVAETSSKVALLLETLEEALSEGHKALVFSQWTSLLDLVEPHLHRAAISFTRLDGTTRDRGEVVNRFQDPQGPPVLLVSLKAGGFGLNLTAADHVFLLDPWWNPAVEDQAADRAHRLGQENPVLVHRLVAEDTVEERILELQRHKRALAEAALGEAEAGAGLTRDDLLALLG